jgi:RIO kinase 1
MSNAEDRNITPYEDKKISGGVFDKASLTALHTLARKGLFDELTGIISTGKEANVYHGTRGEREIVAKIYLIETSDFRNMDLYIKGDRRFSGWRNKRQLVYNWAQKEFCNLHRVYGKIKCPEPLGIEKNVLIIEFIGKDGVGAPKLKDAIPEDPEKFLDTVMNYVKEMYWCDIIHGDLSEYNILNWDEEPYIIDMSMGVMPDHPLAERLLERDVRNTLNFFRKMGIPNYKGKIEPEIIEWVKTPYKKESKKEKKTE